MKKLVYMIALALLTSGCATVKSVNNSYGKIKYANGINASEAKRIAKKVLVESPEVDHYRVFAPKILDNPDTYPHPNYWFVKFERKFYIIKPSDYLVVIDKRTGQIEYSSKQYPSFVKGYRHIFGVQNKNYPWHQAGSDMVSIKK